MKTNVIMLSTVATLIALALLTAGWTAPAHWQVAETPVESPAVVSVIAPPADILPEPAPHISDLPDFNLYSDVREKKDAFFSYMLPMIREANAKVRDHRHALLHMKDQLHHGLLLDDEQVKQLGDLRSRYRIRSTLSPVEAIETLLFRVDVVPESLVLAQAANESGWGTSRFAKQANNMFGVWCFTEGCGLTPLKRAEGKTHEVASYDSVQDSIDAYIHTLNTNRAYTELRSIRASARSENQICGLEMAEGLEKYSARGEDYVREIQAMIRVNNLQQYTQAPRPLSA